MTRKLTIQYGEDILNIPFISRLLMKVSRYENRAVEEYPLLKTIVEYRNEKMYPISVNGISTLNYLASIKGETY